MAQESVQSGSGGSGAAGGRPAGYSIEDATRDRKRVFIYDIGILFVIVILA